jgi:hypothetical protein
MKTIDYIRIFIMDRNGYQEILQPALDEVIDHFIRCEEKHIAGLSWSDNDIRKTYSHASRHLMKEVNPDGCSHVVAAASRSLKAVLFELYGNKNEAIK